VRPHCKGVVVISGPFSDPNRELRARLPDGPPNAGTVTSMNITEYQRHIKQLQVELAKLEYWVRSTGARVVVLFEGRDAAGKGGTIDVLRTGMNPRTVRTVALPAPSPRQQTQWYFQRYVEHLPAAGEMVLFDRSWYNRAGVEPVMGFCTPGQHQRFLRDAPHFEEMLVDDGIHLRKYYLSVTREEQHRRFRARAANPTKRWKVSPVDLAAIDRYDAYTVAKEAMFASTDTEISPWFVVDSNDKKSARVNLISHLLSSLPYADSEPPALVIPPLVERPGKGVVERVRPAKEPAKIAATNLTTSAVKPRRRRPGATNGSATKKQRPAG
jgi:polyphosphate kinase 2